MPGSLGLDGGKNMHDNNVWFWTSKINNSIFRKLKDSEKGEEIALPQCRMDSVSKSLEEVLTSALLRGWVTIGVYETAKALNVDPDNVVLCILATDDEDVKDVALQIHFTLIQAFCCENDINILRVNNTRRLAKILGGPAKQGGEQMDLHCILVT
ncbi:growth arrest and DNA damage-inducible protein GADD45 alpha-like, partial [Clarias magur]